MGRSPCCEKVGLKKGAWSAEEDRILISYIRRHGHSNWTALPKLAGLLRCGKSCRLRWINYLRPDIKRGNFTREEEDTIIALHQVLGNRWSAIAAKLPGRTDNEIKNVWHTSLKKRLPKDTKEKTGNGCRTSCSTSTSEKVGEEEEYSRLSPMEKFLELGEDHEWVEAEKPESRDYDCDINMVLNYGHDQDGNDRGMDFWLNLLSVVGYE